MADMRPRRERPSRWADFEIDILSEAPVRAFAAAPYFVPAFSVSACNGLRSLPRFLGRLEPDAYRSATLAATSIRRNCPLRHRRPARL